MRLEDRTLPSATPLGTPFRVNTYTPGAQQTFPQTPQAVAVNPTTGDFVAVWSSQGQNSGGGWDVYFQRYTAAGTAVGPATLVNAHVQGANQQYAAVAMNANGSFVVTWSGNQLGHFNVYAQQYNANGQALGSAIVVDAPANGNQQFSSVGMDASGNFVISWLGQLSGSTWGVYAREFSSSGTAASGVFQVNDANSIPAGGGGQPGTSVAMNGSGNFVITWSGQQGNQQNVYAQLYGAGGTPAGSVFQVNPNGPNPQQYSAAAMDASGDFVITWSGQVGGGNNWAIYEQRYNASGGVLGSAFQVNSTGGPNLYPSVAMAGGGNFVVTWSAQPPGGGTNFQVYGQQYFANGLPDGNQFLVNSSTAGDQEYSSVAMTTNGRYAVVWSSNGQDGNGWGVYGQRFENSGILITQTAPLVTTQAGATATYQVVLQNAPLQNVTIPISSSDPSQGTVSAGSLLFTTLNWNTPQTVTITGQSDSPYPYFIFNGPAVSGDPAYSGMAAPTLYVNAPQTPEILTSATSVQTTKSGGTATFSVALSTAPVAPVTVTLSNGDTGEGALSQSTLTFDSTNWNKPQSVTVTGLNDHQVNGGVTYQVSGSASSQDPNYNNLGVTPVTVFNKDDVNAVGISVSKTSLQTTQSGGTATFTVVLTSQPLNNAQVQVNLATTDASQGALSQSTLNFEPGHWNVPQTVTVTGLNDSQVQGNVSYQITGTASSPDALYDGLTMTPITVVNHGTDHAGFTVSQTSLTTTKNGGIASFSVALNTRPSATVTLTLNTNGSTAGALSQTTLTFTPDDWNQAQAVTVVGVNDFLVTGNQNYQIKGTATSSDSNYNNKQIPNIQVVNKDTNQASFSVTPTSLVTTTAGDSGTFAVALTSIPANGKSVTLNLSLSDPTQGTLSRSSLPFTPLDWNVYQTVTVTGKSGPPSAGNGTYQITGTAVSGDGNYNNKTMTPVSVTNISPGLIRVSATSLTTTKTGGGQSFSVFLGTPPVADVTIHLNNPAPDEGQLSQSSLTFTTLNWALPQWVTVTGLNDHVVEGNVVYQITGTANSGLDPVYNNMMMSPVTVLNTGNLNTAGITVSAANPLTTTQSGGSATFTIVLNSAPTSNVTIYLGSSDAGQGQFPATVNFDPNNWNNPHTVTVKGLNDFLLQGGSYQITGVAASADGNYDGTLITPVNVVNQATNTPGITVNHTALQTQGEGGTATFTVALNTIPSAPVTVTLTSSDPTHGLVTPTSLVFDASDWNVGQTVTAIAQNAQAAGGDILWQIPGTATSTDANYNNLAMPVVSVDSRENNQAGFVVTPAGNKLVTTQAGGQATFTVALTSAPVAPVTLALSVDKPGEGALSQSVLTFTPTNWHLPQSIVVTGQDDHLANGGGGAITASWASLPAPIRSTTTSNSRTFR
jgi:hypothetical protein